MDMRSILSLVSLKKVKLFTLSYVVGKECVEQYLPDSQGKAIGCINFNITINPKRRTIN